MGKRKTLNTGYQAPSGDYSSEYSAPPSKYSALFSDYSAPSDYSSPSSDYSAPSSNYFAPSSNYSASPDFSAPSSGYNSPAEGYTSPPASDSGLAVYRGQETRTDQRRVRPNTFYEAPASGVLTFFDEKGNYDYFTVK